jgi:transcriptional regulator with XRE-family HTH domain
MSRRPEILMGSRRALGSTLASYRESSRLSQADLAHRTSYSRTSVAHIEAGRQLPGLEFWASADTLLGADGHLVAQYKQVRAEEDEWRLSALRDARTKKIEAAGAMSPPTTKNRNESGVPLGSSEIEPTRIPAMRAMANAFQTADRQAGGGKLYHVVVQYLRDEVAPQLLCPQPYSDGNDLFSAAASLTEIAGWMAHDSGRDSQARQHFDRAFRLSSAANNLALAANVCASMSHLATLGGAPKDAVRLADAGLSRAQKSPGTAHLSARLLTMRARGLALDGDATHCSRALGRAQNILDKSSGTPSAAWIAGFDHGSLASEIALVLSRPGRLWARRGACLRGDRTASR